VEPTFFPAPADSRAWLERHHADERELLVGFYKKGWGRPSITWPESVDEALCFGWIDGVAARSTPRATRSASRRARSAAPGAP
jgi:uncharacterized protein YdeI (YjbR/CyaY-like superfamily)